MKTLRFSCTNTACVIREDSLDASKQMNEQNPSTKMDLFERNWAAQKIKEEEKNQVWRKQSKRQLWGLNSRN